jgi:hypothetical protein
MNNSIYDKFLNIKNYIKEILDKNAIEIKSNNKEINEIINQKNSILFQDIINEKLNYNKDLLTENKKILELYNLLTFFIDKYVNIKNDNFNNDNFNNDIDYFKLTIDGVVEFNETHLFFNDDNFYNMLLEYYKEVEDYKYCQYLIKLKNKNV